MKELPKSMLILGAGVIGMETGFIMASFGVKVTIIEMLPDALVMEDQDAVKVIEKAFKDLGISI